MDKRQQTKCSCIMDLDEDEDLFLSAQALLEVHVRRDEGVRKEFLFEWERNAYIRSIVETKRKKRKTKRKFKGDQKRGRVYPLSGVFTNCSKIGRASNS